MIGREDRHINELLLRTRRRCTDKSEQTSFILLNVGNKNFRITNDPLKIPTHRGSVKDTQPLQEHIQTNRKLNALV